MTTPFPSVSSPKRTMKSSTSGAVVLAGMTSSSFKYLGGLKKCVPKKCFWKSSERPSFIASILMPDVFDVIIVPGLRTASIFSYNPFLTSRFSTMTSIIQSTSFNFSRSSSKFPASISDKLFFVVSGAGFCFTNFCKALDANLFRTPLSSNVSPFFFSSSVNSPGTISRSSTGIPMFARWAAIPDPITPEPKTAAFLI